MILKSIRLHNIRSYEDATIKLPQGSVLLAGDIGAGKTSVLLAVDFALFGIRRNELSGATLLRHGEDLGSVELNMEINGKNILIYRSLKRREKNGNIVQDSGFIEIDGQREDLSIVEMQSRIMQMLNYPLEFAKKNKSLIYRYTVYTPQEAMKQILITIADERLTILRKIFDIDKYKIISENAQQIARQMRADCRELSGAISDIDAKQQELKDKEEELKNMNESLENVEKKLRSSRSALENKMKEKDELNKKYEEMNALKQKVASLQAELNSKQMRNDTVIKEMIELEKEQSALPSKNEIEKLGSTALKMTKEEVENERQKLEKARELLIKDKSVSESDINKWKLILMRGVCNTCGQKVIDKERFKNRITAMQISLKDTEEKINTKNKKLQELAGIRDSIYKHEQELQKKEILLEQTTRVEKNLKQLAVEKEDIAKDIAHLQNQIKIDSGRIDDTIYSRMAEIEKEVQELMSEHTIVEKEHSRLEQQIKDYNNVVIELEKEINEKKRKKKILENTKKKENWVSNLFVPLMGTIEKHVMVQIHKEFNALFQKWFSMLIDNENMDARIDNDFSVIIEQNGYETAYNNLSGGERTSIALAYRLALNAVINKIVEHIRTKDLLILDEPTDGFSAQQLEKVRDVLDELDLRQIIIVSHEPKIESFVDNVIRFAKESGVTQVRK